MRLSDHTLIEIVKYFLGRNKEGECWDFKQEWHENNGDLVKDIVCFANTVHDEDCFIIFGISDDLKPVGMKNPRKTQANVIDTLSNVLFAGDNAPKVSLETINYAKTELDILRIYNTDLTPIYLKKQYGAMKPGCIYTRNGDTNTPDNSNADVMEIERLWKKRLGLTKPALEYILDRLHNRLEWSQCGEYYYNVYKPEYCIKEYYEDDMDRETDEFYAYAQTNEKMSFSLLDIVANNTVIDRYQIANLDSGRLSVPVPEWGFIRNNKLLHDTWSYKYYIEGNDTFRVLEFLYDYENHEARWAFQNLMQVVLCYHTEKEKNDFEEYIQLHLKDLIEFVETSDEYNYINTSNDTKTEKYKKQLRIGTVMNETLEKWRASLV